MAARARLSASWWRELIITSSISALISPDQTASLMASFNASIPCPVAQLTSTTGLSSPAGRSSCTRQVGFVPNQQPFLSRELAQVTLVGVSQRLGIVQHMQDQVRAFKRLPAPANAFPFDFVARLAQSGGIDEDHRKAPNVRRLLNGIARRARHGGDNGAVMTQQLVEQTAFARRSAGQ